jgi:pilus assembly protein CpaB
MTTSARSRATQLGAIGFAAVALGCAALAAYLLARMMDAKGYSKDKVRPVVVAKRALPAAQPFAEEDLTIVQWPESSVPPGAVSDPKALFAGNKTPVPTSAILQGEPVLPARLAGARQGTALAALVRDGYRAVAVKADDSVGRSGLVYPGAFVDVLATVKDPNGRGPSTRIAVSDVRVLAVELETDVATRRPKPIDANGTMGEVSQKNVYQGTVVTLEVTPEDAEVVSLVAREGKVDLALRNGADRAKVETKGAIPLMFSAFAPAPEDGEAPAVLSLLKTAAEQNAELKKAEKGSQAGGAASRRKEGKGRISLDAVRERGDRIETYNAR